MKKLIPSVLAVCAVLSACQVKYQSSNEASAQSSSTIKQYQPEITGRACVKGLSMIRVRFTDSMRESDLATWVYEMKYPETYTTASFIRC